jgi:hypothetical protein
MLLLQCSHQREEPRESLAFLQIEETTIVGEEVMIVMSTFLQVDVMRQLLADKKRTEEKEVDRLIPWMNPKESVAVESGHLLEEVLGVTDYIDNTLFIV